MASNPPNALQQYAVVTGTYWFFTLTDGALRMLVVLHFHQLGYSPLEIASLFLLYELFGVITNLVGGWLGARLGLNTTMHIGVALQVVALGMLAVDPAWLSVVYVMAAQALSGIAKDLNKMSAKSAIKFLLPEKEQQGALYKWVAILTGSKNALKGAGFFLGGVLLAWVGFRQALMLMAIALAGVFVLSLWLLQQDMGKTAFKPKFSQLFSKSHNINLLSAARLFLFGARDVWFVIAVPVYFQMQLGWSHVAVSTFMASWVIGYGIVQSLAPTLTGRHRGHVPTGTTALQWAGMIAWLPALMAVGLLWQPAQAEWWLVAGLLLFGALFAINSSVHSFLILKYAGQEGVSLDVGFYYMANAMGRLVGTLLSGLLFQYWGLMACLLMSSVFLLATVLISRALPDRRPVIARAAGD